MQIGNLTTSETTAELDAALSQLQADAGGVGKGGSNPHYRSSYTRLEDGWAVLRPLLAQHGLSVTQWPEFGDGLAGVRTRVAHKSGEWMSAVLLMPVSGRQEGPQAVGSVLTYAKRYALFGVMGLATDDDDGEAAAAPYRQQQRQAPPPPRRRAKTGAKVEDPRQDYPTPEASDALLVAAMALEGYGSLSERVRGKVSDLAKRTTDDKRETFFAWVRQKITEAEPAVEAAK